ncbi:hypothetical protein PENANT_c005G04475 [Penicillium antarcticum]|uniref:Uncharacterized protein n=1 Tax=Penicillium antarcticum TaxID=416450 RepID=A0A1V6QFT5_9EURO|nr:hypothetical protein PENANT_c005G04475 [Penicillium antarcticum]
MAGEEKLQSRVDGSKMTAELRKLMRKIEKEAESTYADLYANNVSWNRSQSHLQPSNIEKSQFLHPEFILRNLLKPSFIEAPFLGSN